MLMKLSLFIGILIVVPLAYSEDNPITKRVGDWEVGIDELVRSGCYTTKSYGSGDAFRLGVNKDFSYLYFAIGNEKWKSIEKGKEYKIRIIFGDETPWSGSMHGININGFPMLLLNIRESKISNAFLSEFMQDKRLVVEYNNIQIASLSLKGASKSVSVLTQCHKVVDNSSDSGDPFSESNGAKNDDPFSV
ncbi:hypothetical protein BOW53_16520 [Solemya pervernicosa gill symbiont]|uniref:Uncharacterized protein n=1 Tax=Solemya pervernicosa gill symbiont TaxID=642797 RepID=A0A1T2KZ44_9GAMM|nr:hypothetical protein [Solemya pervernicosa gill symbiont]OOZ38112.1 hypothetical protein BOW53_16520 [Solemya pervernicosa gill symbiont]